MSSEFGVQSSESETIILDIQDNAEFLILALRWVIIKI